MSASAHLNYDYDSAGLPASTTRWLYNEVIASEVAEYQYWSSMSHGHGYVGYQAVGNYDSQFQCSNWDSKSHNAPSKSRIVYCGPLVDCKRFGHEGSGWQTSLRLSNLKAQNNRRVAFAVRYENAGANMVRISCWFQTDGFNNGNWFKQAVWEGPGSENRIHASSFSEQFSYKRSESGKIREALYGTLWGSSDGGTWVPVTSARSSAAYKVKEGWTKTDWGTKVGLDGQERWYLRTCGCKLSHLSSCPGQEACVLSNTGGEGAKTISRPSMPRPLAKFMDYLGSEVSCGAHKALTCAECEGGNGASYCNGDCRWIAGGLFGSGQCVSKDGGGLISGSARGVPLSPFFSLCTCAELCSSLVTQSSSVNVASSLNL